MVAIQGLGIINLPKLVHFYISINQPYLEDKVYQFLVDSIQ